MRYLYRWKNAEKCRLNNISDGIFASKHNPPDVPQTSLTAHDKMLDRLHKITYSMRHYSKIGITNLGVARTESNCLLNPNAPHGATSSQGLIYGTLSQHLPHRPADLADG